MRQRILLARDVVLAQPDGNSIKRAEVAPAIIEWPDNFQQRPNDGYYEAGNWVIVSMEVPEEARLCRTCGSTEQPILHAKSHGYVCTVCLKKAKQCEGFEA